MTTYPIRPASSMVYTASSPDNSSIALEDASASSPEIARHLSKGCAPAALLFPGEPADGQVLEYASSVEAQSDQEDLTILSQQAQTRARFIW